MSQTLSVRSKSLSLKYQRLLSGCQDIGIRKFEFVAKTQFLCTGLSTGYEETIVRNYFQSSSFSALLNFIMSFQYNSVDQN